MLTHLDCTKCEKRYEPGRVYTVCDCGAPLFARYDLARAALEMRPGHLALREPTMWRYREVLPLAEGDERVSLGEGFTPLLPPRASARASACRGSPSRRRAATRPAPSRPAACRWPSRWRRPSARPTSACPRPATRAARSPPTPPRPASRPTSSCRATSPGSSSMETEAYGAHVEIVDGLITDAGRRLRRAGEGARLVRVRDPQGALPRRGQEDDGLRDRGADGLDAPRRDPLPDRRRHRPRRHVEGLRRDGGDGLRRREAARGCTRSRPRAARRSSRPSRRAARTRPSGRTPRPTPTACACPRPSATS